MDLAQAMEHDTGERFAWETENKTVESNGNGMESCEGTEMESKKNASHSKVEQKDGTCNRTSETERRLYLE